MRGHLIEESVCLSSRLHSIPFSFYLLHLDGIKVEAKAVIRFGTRTERSKRPLLAGALFEPWCSADGEWPQRLLAEPHSPPKMSPESHFLERQDDCVGTS